MIRLTSRTHRLAARCFVPALVALACFCGVAAHAQMEPAPSAWDKHLARMDFAISGAGIFTRDTSGPVTAKFSSNSGQIVSQSPSSTLGALATLRYVKSPFAGAEINYGYARYTENYSNVGGVQTQANEFTLGYVVTPTHTFFGFQPFVSAGMGVMEFKPTPRGGQGLLKQAAGAYYYSAGVQQEYFSHFGVRASFRQIFFLAPDFYQNYLTTEKHTFTSEPTLGFYLRF